MQNFGQRLHTIGKEPVVNIMKKTKGSVMLYPPSSFSLRYITLSQRLISDLLGKITVVYIVHNIVMARICFHFSVYISLKSPDIHLASYRM